MSEIPDKKTYPNRDLTHAEYKAGKLQCGKCDKPIPYDPKTVNRPLSGQDESTPWSADPICNSCGAYNHVVFAD